MAGAYTILAFICYFFFYHHPSHIGVHVHNSKGDELVDSGFFVDVVATHHYGLTHT